MEATLEAVGPLARAGLPDALSLCWGAAHGTETDDPVDLLRLAAYRSDHPDRGQPAMAPMSVALSDGEEARLALIASNRSRRAGPLIREALDLLFARHG